MSYWYFLILNLTSRSWKMTIMNSLNFFVIILGVPSRGIHFLAPGPYSVDEQSDLQLEDLDVLSTGHDYYYKRGNRFEGGACSQCWYTFDHGWLSLVLLMPNGTTWNSWKHCRSTEKSTSSSPRPQVRSFWTMWYVSEELVRLAFLDKKVPITTKRLMLEILKLEGADEPSMPPRLISCPSKNELWIHSSPNTLSCFLRGLKSLATSKASILIPWRVKDRMCKRIQVNRKCLICSSWWPKRSLLHNCEHHWH